MPGTACPVPGQMAKFWGTKDQVRGKASCYQWQRGIQAGLRQVRVPSHSCYDLSWSQGSKLPSSPWTAGSKPPMGLTYQALTSGIVSAN